VPHAGFVHLRVHSAFSLSEGAIPVKELAELCRGHAMPAVAVTGLLATGGLALGIYAMIAAESRFTGIVILLALLFPSAYFVVLTWAGMHFVVTGKRIRQADLIEAFLARLNRPLRGRRRRSP